MLMENKNNRAQEKEISYLNGSVLTKILDCGFVETSAKISENAEKAFYDVIRSLRRADLLIERKSQFEIDIKTRKNRRQCVIL
jgi:GTPase KRas protein